MNFVECVPLETSVHIFSLLGLSDLASCIGVCKQWKSVADDSLVWKLQCGRLAPQLAVKAVERSDWKHICRAALEKDYQQVDEELGNLAVTGLRSSSQDGSQHVRFTIAPMYFWSSAPNPDRDSDEYLDYELVSRASIVREVRMEAMESQRCYAPRGLRVHLSTSERFEPQHTWSSPVYKVENHSEMQAFSLFDPAQPLLCEEEGDGDGGAQERERGSAASATSSQSQGSGGAAIQSESSDAPAVRPPMREPFLCEFVQLELVGKYDTHFVAGLEDKYYTCISQVHIGGTVLTRCDDVFAGAVVSYHAHRMPGSLLAQQLEAALAEVASRRAAEAGGGGGDGDAEEANQLLSSCDGLLRMSGRSDGGGGGKRQRRESPRDLREALNAVLERWKKEESEFVEEQRQSRTTRVPQTLFELLLGLSGRFE